MADGGTPIAYSVLPTGVPMLTEGGRTFGTVEHVLQIPEEDLFDGIVVRTSRGLRFVDRDQIGEITSTEVRCTLTDDQAAFLPAPEGTPVYDVDSLQDSGQSLHDIFGRLFRRPRWHQEKD
ncbi:MAG: hypothetical protein M3Y35_00770 [Actinomycetota bacterium]|nr:hypothetical protein [Actinomycetota bacterium]